MGRCACAALQASAAAFAKALLDLEGTSLTPILVSLVKKDASMLDAFGKGASDDIRAAKNIVYEVGMHWGVCGVLLCLYLVAQQHHTTVSLCTRCVRGVEVGVGVSRASGWWGWVVMSDPQTVCTWGVVAGRSAVLCGGSTCLQGYRRRRVQLKPCMAARVVLASFCSQEQNGSR